mmetsp:Transcript_63009/g.136813  ORF Transcript_63009/g.136813 Transcript_63009/m.136813 type:complete len:363 (-) Transcript_63009:372-1460(-)
MSPLGVSINAAGVFSSSALSAFLSCPALSAFSPKPFSFFGFVELEAFTSFSFESTFLDFEGSFEVVPVDFFSVALEAFFTAGSLEVDLFLSFDSVALIFFPSVSVAVAVAAAAAGALTLAAAAAASEAGAAAVAAAAASAGAGSGAAALGAAAAAFSFFFSTGFAAGFASALGSAAAAVFPSSGLTCGAEERLFSESFLFSGSGFAGSFAFSDATLPVAATGASVPFVAAGAIGSAACSAGAPSSSLALAFLASLADWRFKANLLMPLSIPKAFSTASRPSAGLLLASSAFARARCACGQAGMSWTACCASLKALSSFPLRYSFDRMTRSCANRDGSLLAAASPPIVSNAFCSKSMRAAASV